MMRVIGTASVALGLCLLSATASAQDLTGTLQGIKTKNAMAIGFRETSVPLSYLDGDQKPVGFSVDLCRLIVEKVKTALDLPNLNVTFTPVTSATRIPLVANGTIDIECGSTANLVARQQQVAFSVTTFAPQFKWIALKSSGLKTTADLKGKMVVLTAGSNTNGFVAKLNTDQSLGLTIQPGKDHAESFLYVETGRAAAFMEDDILLAGLKANSKNPAAFVLLEDEYVSDPYALMIRRDDAPFRKLVNDTLVAAMQSGEYEKLYTKWFERPVPPNGINLAFPMSAKLKGLVQTPSDKALGQ